MTTKERLLRALNAEDFRSGEELAAELGVSRAAVWKAADQLRRDGIPLEAVTHRGYRLAGDVLRAEEIQSIAPGATVLLADSVASTNAALREKAAAGAPEGTALIAREQTAGRGRLGRSFFSPRDSGLYLSLLLRPADFDPRQTPALTAAAAVAMAEAIWQATGRAPGIKWVNDLFLDGRKICGILTEASFSLESGTAEYVVVGVGVNITLPAGGFPPELEGIAGAVLEAPLPGMKNKIAGIFIREFMEYYAGKRPFLDAYRANNLTPGRYVLVRKADGLRQALALYIDDACRLVVRYADGREEALSYGEVILKKD